MKFQYSHLKKLLYFFVIFGWIVVIIHNIHYPLIGNVRNFEYPIGYLLDVSICDGKIYILSESYSRIQVYNFMGKFLFGFNLGTGASMYINDEIIHVLLHRKNLYNQYTLDGFLIESTKLNRTQDLELSKEFEDFPKDDNYRIKYNFIYPTIIVNWDTNEFVKIQSPFYLFFITFPFPIVLYMYILFTFKCIKKVKKNKNRIFNLIKKKNFYKL